MCSTEFGPLGPLMFRLAREFVRPTGFQPIDSAEELMLTNTPTRLDFIQLCWTGFGVSLLIGKEDQTFVALRS